MVRESRNRKMAGRGPSGENGAEGGPQQTYKTAGCDEEQHGTKEAVSVNTSYVNSKSVDEVEGTSTQPTSRISFMDLPRELRDIVYGFALNASPNVRARIWSPRRQKYVPASAKLLSNSIFHLSKTIKEEAEEIFYGESMFLFYQPPRLCYRTKGSTHEYAPCRMDYITLRKNLKSPLSTKVCHITISCNSTDMSSTPNSGAREVHYNEPAVQELFGVEDSNMISLYRNWRKNIDFAVLIPQLRTLRVVMRGWVNKVFETQRVQAGVRLVEEAMPKRVEQGFRQLLVEIQTTTMMGKPEDMQGTLSSEWEVVDTTIVRRGKW
ncbi:uncharacterized protein BDZ99DRAFT_570151 [Mytilinidion resinicola]|uniref:Uncharacterized protein n=1 Tax=Mytilinidion resinicola TaxID=574789 RepID=A0A6A6YQN7_9PEZI|nr:uncharacterized protein BDZ99DRAFT_570151 [Mytilinidion resinicola]KAF2810848.1 hypothetical protein BDZ99DRAFT_570151 [Mytilinidion resinicola]